MYVSVSVSVHAYVCARECVERAEEKQMLFFTSCLFKKSYLLRQGLLLAWSLSSRLSEPQASELGLQSCAFMPRFSFVFCFCKILLLLLQYEFWELNSALLKYCGD